MKKHTLVFIFLLMACANFAQPLNTLSAEEKKQGFVLLFNGKDLSGWRAVLKQTPPEKGWEVVDGSLHVLDSAAGGKSGDLLTSGQYKAFELKFEFKLTEGANSGVKYFVTESPQSVRAGLGLEFQVLDDEHHADAKLGKNGNRKMGSLYDIIPSLQIPKGQRKIGEWNEGKIIVYPNNHVEHWLNGYKVVEYERGNPAFKEAVAGSKFAKSPDFGLGEQGPLLIQDHGNSVFYRNIKIRQLK